MSKQQYRRRHEIVGSRMVRELVTLIDGFAATTITGPASEGMLGEIRDEMSSILQSLSLRDRNRKKDEEAFDRLHEEGLQKQKTTQISATNNR